MHSRTDAARAARWMPAAIVCAILLVYANAIPNQFTNWDDEQVILGNPYLRPLSLPQVATVLDPSAPRTLQGGQYAPVGDLSYALDFALHGEDPQGFHYVAILAHAASALLAFGILCLLGLDRVGAGIAVLLFALHPAQCDSVTWLSGRRTVLCGAFSLACLWSYLQATRRGRRWGWPLSALCMLLALGSKQFAILLPAAALLLDLCWPEAGRSGRETLRRHLPALAAGGALSVLATWLFVWVGRREGVIHASPGLLLVPLDLSLVSRYLAVTLLPIALRAHYALPMPQSIVEPPVWIGLVALIALGAVVRSAWSKKRWIAFGILWYFLWLVPALHWVPGPQLMAERYLYLSLLGPGVVIGATFAPLVARRDARKPAIVVVALLALLAAGSVRRNLDFRSSLSLWRRDVAVDPQSPGAQRYLGRALQTAGEPGPALAAFDRADALYQEPGRSAPPHLIAQLQRDRGYVLAQLGRYVEAEVAYRLAHEIEPRERSTRVNLANLAAGRGAFPPALALTRGLIEEFPTDPEIRKHASALVRDVSAHELRDPTARADLDAISARLAH